MPPLLLSSQTAFKELVYSWSQGCTIVIDVLDPLPDESQAYQAFIESSNCSHLGGLEPKALSIQLDGVGKSPPQATLVIKTTQPWIFETQVVSDPEAQSLAAHPQLADSCSSNKKDACSRRDDGDVLVDFDDVCGGTSWMKYSIGPFDLAYSYRLRTLLLVDPMENEPPVVLLEQRPELGVPACSVRPAGFFTLYVQSGPWGRFALLGTGLLALTVVAAALKQWISGS